MAGGAEALVPEAMKMPHGLNLPAAGRVLSLAVAPGDDEVEGQLLMALLPVEVTQAPAMGAQAMAVCGFDAPVFTVAWPTGEFGDMRLEGAVKPGFRKELAAADGPDGETSREALYQQLVARQYAKGSAINMATHLEIDSVIDPAETRARLMRGLDSCANPRPHAEKRFVDP